MPELVIDALVLLAAGVVAAALFRRLGLSPLIGYLAAGVLIGPALLGVFREPAGILTIAELGIVFFLFVIGLELDLKRLWAMRRDIFVLGTAQVAICTAVLMIYPLALDRGVLVALVAGMGLALSSTPIVMGVLEERNEQRSRFGRKVFAILLMQDLAFVPMLAVVALVSADPGAAAEPWWLVAGKAVGGLAVVLLAGRFLLNPTFALLARVGAREVMTAAALLVVLLAGTIMTLAGFSMAMGAFLAGVLLAESNYRHQLQADIEPFRGLLLGLFFLAVGMSLDVSLIPTGWPLILGGVAVLILFKTGVIAGLMRLSGIGWAGSLRGGLYLSQGSEFGFVLWAAAVAGGAMSQEDSSLLVAAVILSMALTPVLIRFAPKPPPRRVELDPAHEDFSQASGDVLIIGFGRFGQVVAQMMLAAGHGVVVIDADPYRVAEAKRFGNHIWYGDGRRLDILQAAGAGNVQLVVVCTDDRASTDAILATIRDSFPDTPVFARVRDRGHVIDLAQTGMPLTRMRRETFDSAVAMGRMALEAMGDAVPAEVETLVRDRDEKRLAAQILEGDIMAGPRWVQPEPVVPVPGEEGALKGRAKE